MPARHEDAAEGGADGRGDGVQALLPGDGGPDPLVSDDAREERLPARLREGLGTGDDESRGVDGSRLRERAEDEAGCRLDESRHREDDPRVDRVRDAAGEAHGCDRGEGERGQEGGDSERADAEAVQQEDRCDRGDGGAGGAQCAGEQRDPRIPDGPDRVVK